MTGIGLGGTLVPLLSVWLVHNHGWHNALRILGVLIIVIALPLAYFVREAPDKGVTSVAKATTAPIGWAFKSKMFYLLAIGSMCSIGAVGGTNQHLKLFLSIDQHYSQELAARVVSLVLASSLVGRLLMGWLADRYAKKYVMLLIYSLVAASIPLLFFASTPGVIYLFAVLFGIGLGGDYMIIPLMAAELFGVKIMGRLMGVVLTADGVAEAVIPMLVGAIYERANKNYSMGFSLLIALAIIGAISILMLPKKQSERRLET
jgi:sugar phosphate permease